MTDAFDPARPESVTPSRIRFHTELDLIDEAFVTAASQVSMRLPEFTTAFLDGDRSVIADANELAALVASSIQDIQDRGFVLLALEAPVGRDLRRLVALLRVVSDVDRSAALLRHICATLERFDPRLLAEDMRERLSELATRSGQVFTAGVDAWRQQDALAVFDVDDADSDVDRLQQRLLEQARTIHEAGNETLVLGLIARYYERIADHGVAIAQDATFVVSAQRVKAGRQRATRGQDGD